MADRAIGRGLPPPLEPVRVGGPAPTATTVLPPSDKSSGHPEERQCPGGKPCRWAQRVTPAPSCPGGAAAEPEGGEGAGVGMSRKWRRQQLDSREVLGALRAMSCCLRQPPSLPGRERRKARWRGGQEQSQPPEGLSWHGQARRRALQGRESWHCCPGPAWPSQSLRGSREMADGRAGYVGFLVRIHQETLSF